MNKKKLKVLVTGGAGFIGSHVVEHYLVENAEVVIVDDMSMGCEANIPDSDQVTFYNKSITDYDFMSKLIVESNFDYIYLLAAIASVADTIERPLESHEVNQNANIHVLETLRLNNLKPKRVLFASSAAVYGNLPELPKSEYGAVLPMTPYAIDKYATEKFVLAYSKLYEIPTAVARFFNVYGPRQNPQSPYSGVLSILTSAMVEDKTFKIFGDGDQTRDFVFVKDVVQALVLLSKKQAAVGHVYNVGTGSSISLNDTIDVYSEVTGIDVDTQYQAPRVGDIKFSSADITRLKGLGYEAKFSVKEGLAEYWKSLEGGK